VRRMTISAVALLLSMGLAPGAARRARCDHPRSPLARCLVPTFRWAASTEPSGGLETHRAAEEEEFDFGALHSDQCLPVMPHREGHKFIGIPSKTTPNSPADAPALHHIAQDLRDPEWDPPGSQVRADIPEELTRTVKTENKQYLVWA